MVFNKAKDYYDAEVKSKGLNIYYLPNSFKLQFFYYIENLMFFKLYDIDVLHCYKDWIEKFTTYAEYKVGIKIIVHSRAKQDLFEKYYL